MTSGQQKQQEGISLSQEAQEKLDVVAVDALRRLHARYREMLMAQQRVLCARAGDLPTAAAAARDRYLGESLLKSAATIEALESYDFLCGGQKDAASKRSPALCFAALSHAVKDLKVAPSEIFPRLDLTPKALMNKAARRAFTKEERRAFAKQSDQQRQQAHPKRPYAL